MSDKNIIATEDIKMSSNQNNAQLLRPSGVAWESAQDDKNPSAVIKVGTFLETGGSVKLALAKNIESYDILIFGGDQPFSRKVSMFLLYLGLYVNAVFC